MFTKVLFFKINNVVIIRTVKCVDPYYSFELHCFKQ